MVDRTRVSIKLAELNDRVTRVKQHCARTPAELAANRDALDLVSFNLMLAVQACADIASDIIADEGWPATATLAESFQRLSEKGVISTTTAGARARRRSAQHRGARIFRHRSCRCSQSSVARDR